MNVLLLSAFIKPKTGPWRALKSDRRAVFRQTLIENTDRPAEEDCEGYALLNSKDEAAWAGRILTSGKAPRLQHAAQ